MGKSEQFRYTPLEGERDVVRLLDDINTRSLDPFIYSFVRQRPRPREVIAGLMQMKIPQQHFDTMVRPLVEAELTDRTFNNRNDYGKIRDLVEEVSPKWLKYCHYNDDRRCFEANDGYKHNDLLIRKYGFKFNKLKHKNNDKTGNRRAQERAGLAHT